MVLTKNPVFAQIGFINVGIAMHIPTHSRARADIRSFHHLALLPIYVRGRISKKNIFFVPNRPPRICCWSHSRTIPATILLPVIYGHKMRSEMRGCISDPSMKSLSCSSIIVKSTSLQYWMFETYYNQLTWAREVFVTRLDIVFLNFIIFRTVRNICIFRSV